MKIVVGLSGGIDSTITAYILKKQGYQVVGVTMSILQYISSSGLVNQRNIELYSHYGLKNIKKIYALTQALDIPLYVIDCYNEYKDVVLKYLISAYKSGNTPNPCVQCNKHIKFNVLLNKTKKLGIYFDKFATGHYANIHLNKYTKTYILTTAFDKEKDQTYFLHKLTSQELSRIIFPLFNLTKNKVKQFYNKLNLPIIAQKESQDLCFGKTRDLLKCLPANYGNILNIHGKVIGKHNGIWNYTIGQRKNLGNLTQAVGPLYVINILPTQNVIIVGEKIHLYSSSCIVNNISWHIPILINRVINTKVKIRSQHVPAKATVILYTPTQAKVEFENKQMSITKGQSAVFYNGKFIIGGGTIS
ncbi:MAG: tRNA 2-thiouridine(34) synthase MnmA [Endomicrobium sp.]|jgi:tRNA-specific 2-thiouridylase|nr:tRNA 2-thiouridine(34) synthase MnmA [Endomicrobium sp.]